MMEKEKPIFDGPKFVWGVPEEILPIVGLPAGKVRLRFRPVAFSQAFVKTASGIEVYYIDIDLENPKQWKAGLLMGRTVTVRAIRMA